MKNVEITALISKLRSGNTLEGRSRVRQKFIHEMMVERSEAANALTVLQSRLNHIVDTLESLILTTDVRVSNTEAD